MLVLLPAVSNAADLKPETLSAWERYIAQVDARVKTAANSEGAFVWSGEDADRMQRLQRGEIVAAQVQDVNAPPVPHGLIHDWVGAVFVPGATLEQSIAFSRDYEQYPKWYGPTIAQANLHTRSSDQDCFTIRYVRTVLFVKVVLDADYETRWTDVNATRAYSTTRSLRIQEVEEIGGPEEHRKAADSGYIWRIYSVTKFDERENGVYIEQENVVLSRPIPRSFRWMVEPAIRRLAKDLLIKFLRQTRAGILALNQ